MVDNEEANGWRLLQEPAPFNDGGAQQVSAKGMAEILSTHKCAKKRWSKSASSEDPHDHRRSQTPTHSINST